MVGRCIRKRRLIRSTEAYTATLNGVCGALRPGGIPMRKVPESRCQYRGQCSGNYRHDNCPAQDSDLTGGRRFALRAVASFLGFIFPSKRA
jgi:hypothetical protein